MGNRNETREALSFGMRLGVELVVATLVGAVMGYALDWFFATQPWFLIVGTLLGGAAGFVTVYRLATQDSNHQKPPDDSTPPPGHNKDDLKL